MNIGLIDIILFLTFLLEVGIGGFLLIKNKKPAIKPLAAFSLACGLWSLGVGLFRCLPIDSIVLLSINRFLIGSGALAAPTFLHFIFSFTNKKLEGSRVFLIYLPALIFEVLLFVPNALISGFVVYSWGKGSALGFAYPLFTAYFIIYYAIGFFILGRTYLKSSGEYKHQLEYMLFTGFITCSIGVFFNIILVPFLNYQYVWAGPLNGQAWVIGLAYAITKHDLLDIRISITKTGAFLGTLVLFGTGYLALLIPYRIYISTQTDPLFIIWSISYGGLIVGLFFHRVQQYLITTAEKKFLLGKYDTSLILQNLSSQLVYVSDRDQVIQIISEEFARSMELKSVHAFIPKISDFKAVHIKWVNQEVTAVTGEPIVWSDAALAELRDYSEPKLWTAISDEMKRVLQKEGVHEGSVILAMNSLQNLEGLLILGPKLIEAKYTDHDVSIFSFITNQIMVVFDRISYQEKLKLSYEDVNWLNKALNETNKELDFKVKEAIALAQKHFHQAALASLVSGIAHEICNPMTSLMGYANHVAGAFKARRKDAIQGSARIRVKDALGSPAKTVSPWQFSVHCNEFLEAVNGDLELAKETMEALRQLGWVTPDGDLTDKVDLISLDMDDIELGPKLAPYQSAIYESLTKKVTLLKFLNVIGSQIPRILTITDNMMKYGASGGGIKKESFAKIEGISIADSEWLFNSLIENGYLDHKGSSLIKGSGGMFEDKDALKRCLDPQYHPKIDAIIRLIEEAPGAVKKPVDIQKIMASALSIQAGALKASKIQIITEYAADIPAVSGDEWRIQQALFNIIFNAQQAMEGHIRSDSRQHELTVKIERKSFQNQGGLMVDGVCVIISDTGNGMSDQKKKKIFDPFFTTKGLTGGKNIGLGLSILREVVLFHDGSIDVDSEEGGGTTFSVYFPVYKS